ncbi:MAG: aldolase/citrate lyase family protein [bacterium]|nr:aldolase/citrate lyase family protein [bacterium]
MNKVKSLLFVPVTEKFLSKVESITANAIIFDLEDSIALNKKEDSRILLRDFLDNSNIYKNAKWFVRINKEYAEKELQLYNNTNIDGYMLPKFENLQNFINLKNAMNNKKVIALIETAQGILNIDKIAKSDLITAFAFGAEDYTASMNMKNSFEYLSYPKSKLITYAKANKKFVYDTPCFNVKDCDFIKQDVIKSAEFGFDGKMAINPIQINIINNIFNDYDLDYLKYIVSEFDKSENGVLVIGDKIYEKMHIARFKKILNNI